MRIGMVLENPFPPDIRVEKEMIALKRRNHELFLLCRGTAGQALGELSPLACIVRLPPAHQSIVKRCFNIAHQWITSRNKEWESAILRFIKDKGIEAVHVHDLPLASSAISAARKTGIPVVVDLHEIYPEMVRSILSFREAPIGISRRLWFSLLSPRWWGGVERKVVRDADRVVVVIEESKRRLIEMGITEEKVFVVTNVTDIDEFTQQASTVQPVKKSAFTVCYVGGVDGANRGLHNLVKAWPLVLKKIPDAVLWIVGDGWVRSYLEGFVRSRDLEISIRFEGQVPFKKVAAYISAADVTIIPHVVNEHTNNTIPHKLFQYLALGKIVVTSDIKPIRRILEDTGSGVVVNEWTPEGFASAIVKSFEVLQSGAHSPNKQIQVLREKYGFQTMVDSLLGLYKGLEA
jgi:glycosyltransferase involved in cell wall biosynthesis